jgi:regulator of protease activity HflC (stomatin/prohibitin superfamily)
MFGINYIKADPSTHLMQFKNGAVVKEGLGTSFFYYGPSSSLVAVPVNSRELPFVFRMQTQDFQDISIQGQVTYRIVKPGDAVKQLNFTIDANGRYLSEDPNKVEERVLRSVQVSVRNQIERRKLREALTCAMALTNELKKDLDTVGALGSLGIEINDVALTAIIPNPETGKALEAEVRESLLRESDNAVYARRLASIEQEKSVKESELETEKAIQKKQQDLEKATLEAQREQMQQRFQINQERITAQIEDEEQLKALVELNVANERARADAEAYKIKVKMEAYAQIDTERLKVMSMSGMGPEQLIAQAIENLTQGDNKIGNLNLSPDLLQSLLRQ